MADILYMVLVNTAARMESTGMRDKIQISQETADLLIAAGKTHLFTKREGLVQAKGKGQLQTYWLQSGNANRRGSMGQSTENRRRHSMGGTSRNPSVRDVPKMDLAISAVASERNVGKIAGEGIDSLDSSGVLNTNLLVHLTKKQNRLVDWNCEMIQCLIRQIVARRNFLKTASKPIQLPFTAMLSDLPKFGVQKQNQQQSTMPLDEVVEVINLPEFDVAAYHGSTDAKHIRLDPAVVAQLRRFISLLATKYRDNPFHNFDHASRKWSVATVDCLNAPA
jgi:Adenylate and Guanylate cyclase catalytic domain